MKRIPKEIVTAVNALLAPYGESFTPNTVESEYLSFPEAVSYTKLSRSTLTRAIRSGKLPRPFQPTGQRNSLMLFKRSDLDAFIQGTA
jgi:excisionase family DNA binding protein